MDRLQSRIHTLDYSKHRRRWFWWPTVLAALLAGHFSVSVFKWSTWIGFWLIYSRSNNRDTYLFNALYWLWFGAPAYLFWLLSIVVLMRAVNGKQDSRRGVVFILVASITFFTVDAYFLRWLYGYTAANVGSRNVYPTWWWWDDRSAY